MQQCTATAAISGQRCRKIALRGDYYCAMHTPEAIDARDPAPCPHPATRTEWHPMGGPLEWLAEIACNVCGYAEFSVPDPGMVSRWRAQAAELQRIDPPDDGVIV